jgi:mannose-6-phosphate isomerase
VYDAQRQDKPWGQELIFTSGEDGYVGKIIYVRAGEALSLQYHRAKIETITVVTGRARFEYGADEHDLTTVELGPGEVIHLPAEVRHRISAVEDVTFVEASTAQPGWREDVVRLEDRYGRTGTSAP